MRKSWVVVGLSLKKIKSLNNFGTNKNIGINWRAQAYEYVNKSWSEYLYYTCGQQIIDIIFDVSY